ncbi:MAG TPA: trypsin-like peptidase domain-containing protein [Terriglobales bacterium]|nr:trypsin-like peptidase domain-containing protein [Terriglobales bacterium]
MKAVRPILLAIVLAGAFFYLTTHRPGSWKPSGWFGGEKLELTEAAQGNGQLDGDEQVNVAVYKKGIPSVVNITSTVRTFDFFYGVMPQEGQGTGFIIDKEGHILTNYHVVQGRGAKIEVTLYNRKKYPARVIGYDAPHDLAVIKVDAPNLSPVVLGDSRGLQVGQKVFAIGNPFGLSGTMTRGIVSAIRPIESPNGMRIDDAIQTDAAINPGNSGGPLLNSRAEVIGINSMILTGGASQSAGVGFAIPINTAKAVLNDLVTRGHVARPYLGIRGALPISPELANEMGLPADYGVLLIDLVPGGPAQRAGLRGGSEPAYLGNTPIKIGGDLVVSIDGEDIQELRDIANIMNNRKAGDTVTISVYRGKRKIDIRVTLGEAPERLG